MSDALTVLLAEYAQLRAAEQSTRTALYAINGFAVAVVSGLIIGIQKVGALAFISPLVVYLVGFMWSAESLRLLRIAKYLREVERATRSLADVPAGTLPPGFEDTLHTGVGWRYFMRRNSLLIAAALMYLVFFLTMLYLLWTSDHSLRIRALAVSLVLVFCGLFWAADLWAHRGFFNHFWLPSFSPSPTKPSIPVPSGLNSEVSMSADEEWVGWRKRWWPWAFSFASLLYLSAIVWFLISHMHQQKGRVTVAFAVIVIGPPLWFVFEYFVLCHPKVHQKKDLRDRFKFHQDLVRYIWLAVAAVSGAMLTYLK